ncbi:unnamed protein product [Menidia menidia]|uniref:(Atlantic silverside) hypothetical protein n=1 Tax=Menidia menidia TaxID=238744 RepID=A0A8S4BY39_9TELE|nr:unnamed protein product [Menidia menidia]
MAFFIPGLTVLLITLFPLSAQDTGSLEIVYHQKTFRHLKGSSAELSCKANYNFELCEVIDVFWLYTAKNIELTDPRKYFTTVNETDMGNNRRSRLIVTKIFRVTAGDSGRYQCKAECNRGEETAMGHFITIIVGE